MRASSGCWQFYSMADIDTILRQHWVELIPDVANREQAARMLGVVFEFGAQPPNRCGDDAARLLGRKAPHMPDDLATGADPAAAFHQERQQVYFAGREVNSFAAFDHTQLLQWV